MEATYAVHAIDALWAAVGVAVAADRMDRVDGDDKNQGGARVVGVALSLRSAREAERALRRNLAARGYEGAPGEGGLAAAALGQLAEYAAGRRREFELPLDLSAGGEFARRAWGALRRVGYGETRSYGWLARAIGSPRAARAVGGALGANPVPIIVPCHRIVRADGSLGGYTGGLAIKRELLRIEGRFRACP